MRAADPNKPPLRFGKLRIAWTVGWGVVTMLLVALWVRSYVTFDRLTMQPLPSPASNYLLISYKAHIAAVRVGFLGPALIYREPKLLNRDSGPVNPRHRQLEDLPWPAPSFLGFGWMTNRSYSNIPNNESGWLPIGLHDRSWTADATGFRIPYWCLALVSSCVAIIPWLRLHMRPRFSLRTLLIAMTLLAVLLGLMVYLSTKPPAAPPIDHVDLPEF